MWVKKVKKVKITTVLSSSLYCCCCDDENIDWHNRLLQSYDPGCAVFSPGYMSEGFNSEQCQWLHQPSFKLHPELWPACKRLPGFKFSLSNTHVVLRMKSLLADSKLIGWFVPPFQNKRTQSGWDQKNMRENQTRNTWSYHRYDSNSEGRRDTQDVLWLL